MDELDIINKWQKRLLPFMTKILITLSVFFFLGSVIQFLYLNNLIFNNPKINVQRPLSDLILDSSLTHEQILENTRLKALVLLEEGSLQNQYYQANTLLISRLWISYLGFVTGMIMAVVGAVFILGKLSESMSSITAKIAGNDISFKSASPGLILSFLGVSLMITTIIVRHDITSKYNATYIHDTNSSETKSENENIQPDLRPPH
jgi:hypothetical protein